MRDWSRPSQTYQDMALSHGQLAGYKQGGWPIVKRFEHPAQWREWYAYYCFRKLKFQIALMEERDEKTVPTLSPFNFDAEFNGPVGGFRPVPRNRDEGNAPPTPEARERVARIMAAFRGAPINEMPDRYARPAA